MHEFFKGNEAKNNFVKEDAESEECKECAATLDGLRKVNLTNLAVICIKKKESQKVVDYCDECLKLDPSHIKAMFLKGRALIEMTEFKKAIEAFTALLDIEPDHAEAKNELKRANQLLK